MRLSVFGGPGPAGWVPLDGDKNVSVVSSWASLVPFPPWCSSVGAADWSAWETVFDSSRTPGGGGPTLHPAEPQGVMTRKLANFPSLEGKLWPFCHSDSDLINISIDWYEKIIGQCSVWTKTLTFLHFYLEVNRTEVFFFSPHLSSLDYFFIIFFKGKQKTLHPVLCLMCAWL